MNAVSALFKTAADAAERQTAAVAIVSDIAASNGVSGFFAAMASKSKTG